MSSGASSPSSSSLAMGQMCEPQLLLFIVTRAAVTTAFLYFYAGTHLTDPLYFTVLQDVSKDHDENVKISNSKDRTSLCISTSYRK